MIIDHAGIVVKSIEKGIENWNNVFGYEQMTEIVINTRQRVKVVFLKKNKSLLIKLTEPLDEKSSIFGFAQKGGGLHHICFRCDNLQLELDRLKAVGLRVIAQPQPGEAFENENIAFVYANQGLNIELIDTEKKAKLI